jgi:hypothetical protein
MLVEGGPHPRSLNPNLRPFVVPYLSIARKAYLTPSRLGSFALSGSPDLPP